MRHFDLPRPGQATSVIYPWDYVSMRRRAAGLSLEQLAAALSRGGSSRVYMRHLRALETPGLRLQHLADLPAVIPFSVEVYRQLADLPTHQHPPLCVRCGWDQHLDQPDRMDSMTGWSRTDPAICTRCEQDAQIRGPGRCAC